MRGMFGVHQPRIEAIRRVLETLRPAQIVDIGCNDGSLAEYVTQGLPGTKVIGLDGADTALKDARDVGLECYNWNIESEPCPLAAETADCVLAGEIIEHLVDTRAFMAEIHRILEPGGHVIITTPNLTFWLNRYLLLRGRIPVSYCGTAVDFAASPTVNPLHIRINAWNEWAAFVVNCGFTIVSLLGCESPLYVEPKWRWIDRWLCRYPSLTGHIIIVAQKSQP
jgi:SAM-dependent methyltransferase